MGLSKWLIDRCRVRSRHRTGFSDGALEGSGRGWRRTRHPRHPPATRRGRPNGPQRTEGKRQSQKQKPGPSELPKPASTRPPKSLPLELTFHGT